MSVWASKDPDAVQDRSYTIPLDEGDAVATHELTRIVGTVNIDSEDIAGAVVTAWLPYFESGKRDSNPRPQPLQVCALPTELFPRAD